MVHRFIAAATLCAYCFWMAGCTATTRDTIIRDELPEWANEKIVEVMLDNGDIVRFDEAGGRYVPRNAAQTSRAMIVGLTWNKKTIEVDVKRVLEVKIERTEMNAGGTLLLIFVGIPVAVLAVIVVIFIISPPRF
jgi:hypothetical protein